MKLTCEQQTLVKALNIVSKAVTSRTTIPILKGILMKAENNKLMLSSSDLEISIETEISAQIETDGSIVVSAKLFNDIIRKIPQGSIILDVDENGRIMIISGYSEFTLQGLEVDEFPKITNEEKGKEMIFEKELIRNMIKGTCYAASIDESRGIITGVLMEISKDNLTMVALDGFRMAIKRETVKNEKEIEIVIAARIMNEIGKILNENEDDEDVKIIADDKKVVFVLKDTRIVARLMEGKFIKYKDILPKNNRIKIKINKNDLMDSVERSSIIAREGKNSFIKFRMEEKRLIITSNSEEGSTKEEIKIEKEGENIEIGFNAKYMADTLRIIYDDEVSMEFNTSISPCLIKPLEGNIFEYLILPIRLSTGNV